MTESRKTIYVYGIELEECSCGVWRSTELPCWSHQDRDPMFVEAVAQLRQAVRNIGYAIAKATRLLP